MSDLVLYLGMTLAGHAAGAALRRTGKRAPWASKTLSIVVCVLVFSMGTRIGANEEVISNLNLIGLYALGFTVLALAGTVICLSLTRRMLGIDKFGMVQGSAKTEHGADCSEKTPVGFAVDKSTIAMICSVAFGIAVGFAAIRYASVDFEVLNAAASTAIRIGLCTLLVLIGLDLGVEGTVVGSIRQAGLRVLAVPAAVAIGTLAAAAAFSIVLPVSLHESLAIGSGFGWYSLAPGIIMDQGYITAGAISFMHNVLRELLSIVTIPFVARRIGYIESCGLAGAAAMDVCLPIVERSTNGITAVYSFVSGLVLSIAVPIMVPIFC